MAHDYSALTGEMLVENVQKSYKRKKILCIVGIPVCCIVLLYSLLQLKSGSDGFMCILFAAISVILIYVCLKGIADAKKLIADPMGSMLFKKFGSPESIAQRIAAESGSPLLDAKGALICDSFIMKHGDFESFVPLEEALWVYREEHRTNGIPDGVYLIIYDSYGCKNSYPFKFGKTGKDMMTDIMKHISEKAPKCAFGYSKEAEQYMQANRKTIST